MKKILSAALAAFCAASALSAAADEPPAETAKRVRSLIDRYAPSAAVVQYWFKRGDDGETPVLSVRYKCPNCGGTHSKELGGSIDDGIPAEFAGFLVAPDKVLTADLVIDPKYVDRIAVECAGETLGAVEFEASPENGALVLKTERPFASAKPIEFSAGEDLSDPSYFYLVREDGETVAGIKKSNVAGLRRYLESGREFYSGNPNTIVVDGEGRAATVALLSTIELGRESFAPPSSWRMEPAAARFERLAALEAKVRKSVFPVYVQLEAETKNSRGGLFSMRFGSSDEEASNDIDAMGVLFPGGRVEVLANLSQKQTARISKIEAALPDGGRALLEFTGSHVREGAFAAAFPGGIPAGLEPAAIDVRPPCALRGERFVGFGFANRGGRLDVRRAVVKVSGARRARGNIPVAEFDPVSEWSYGRQNGTWYGAVVSESGEFCGLTVKNRLARWSDDIGLQGRTLAGFAGTLDFDPENVPRASGDRRRVPWLGVETQVAGPDVVREKKATGYVDDSSRAALVTTVAPGTPAESLGIKPGDILVSVKAPGGTPRDVSPGHDMLSEIDWEEFFNDDRAVEFAGSGEIMPWPDVEGGVNRVLAEFGVGAEVSVVWVSGGTRREGTTRLALAPVHFRNAPRARNKELGVTVCDMTDEVRRYFKLDASAPGVVVAKTKNGGVAAVAGIRPLELILDVNGEGVKSAKDFLEKTKGAKELSFTVRRLSATRIVPVKL